ncbi:MAG: (Fe-S)-binding protein [Nitrososphaerales archaeon]
MEFKEYEKLLACVHCGLCLPFCPTYRIFGREQDSPRGRLYMIRSYAEGRIDMDEEFDEHINLCLVCRACESACPSNVKFGLIMEEARNLLEKNYKRGLKTKLYNWLIYREIWPNPSRLRFTFKLMRLLQRLMLDKIAKKVKLLDAFPGKPSRFLDMVPIIPDKFFNSGIFEPLGERRYKVGFLSGCIMGTLLSPINEATVRVLRANDCEVIVPDDQVCCGALNSHSGYLDTAKEMAKRNIDAFLKYDLDAIIVNSAGCGATMKEYKEILRDDEAYKDKAKDFSSKVKDLSEFLAQIPLNNNFGELKLRVTMQDPCHLIHGQKISIEPRKLLSMIPGIELEEMPFSDRCCGSAGNYFITHYDTSMQILDEKISYLKLTKAQAVIASNPPCYIQLKYGVKRSGLKMDVLHIAEVLDRAYKLGGVYQI